MGAEEDVMSDEVEWERDKEGEKGKEEMKGCN